MSKRWSQSWAALFLAALLMILGGCGAPEGADSAPTAADSPAPPSGQAQDVPAVASGEAVSDSPTPTAAQPSQSPSPSQSAVPTPPPAPKITGTVAEGVPVEETWFSDAVFVGDSRTDGLMLYSGITSASFISHQGLSVFNIGSKECIELEGEKVTALTALGQAQYAKVYLMLGINELGYGSESYREAYTRLVGQIRELQPNATIYLQTLPPVDEALAQSKGISTAITNNRVKLFNSIITEISESEETALVDVASAFWTEAGNISRENTSDGVHLTRQGYVTWFQFLQSHTGTTEPMEAGEGEGDPIQDPNEPPTQDPAQDPGQPPAEDPVQSAEGAQSAQPAQTSGQPQEGDAAQEPGQSTAA